MSRYLTSLILRVISRFGEEGMFNGFRGIQVMGSLEFFFFNFKDTAIIQAGLTYSFGTTKTEYALFSSETSVYALLIVS